MYMFMHFFIQVLESARTKVFNFQVKYSSSVGRLRSKYFEVELPYKHVTTFCRIAETTYIFPMLLNISFRFFLKSINLKCVVISPNTAAPQKS